MPYEEAERAFAEGRGIFRDHRRKIVLAVRPHEPSTSVRSSPALNGHDALDLVGARHERPMSHERRERIAEWGKGRRLPLADVEVRI
jgi:hypothetical protein